MTTRDDKPWSVLVELGIVFSFAGQLLDRRLAPLGLSPVHFGVLSVVSAVGPITPTKLEREIGLLPTTLRERLQVLERDGLVHRVANPRDRRSHFVEITPDGVALMRQARSAARRVEREVSAALGHSIEEYRPGFVRLHVAQHAVLEGGMQHSDETEDEDAR